MSQSNIQELLSQVTRLASSSKSAAMAVLSDVYRGPILNDQMAQNIILANHHLKDESDDFVISFITRLKAYTLEKNGFRETLSAGTVDWLIQALDAAWPHAHLSEIDLVLGILMEAQPKDDRLANWLVTQICRRMIAIGYARREETRRLVRALNHCKATVINRNEAKLLLMVNDAVANQYNDMSWPIIFSRGISNFLLALAHPDPAADKEILDRSRWITADRRNGEDLAGKLAQEFDQFGWFDRLALSVKHAERARAALASEVPKRKLMPTGGKRNKANRLDNSSSHEVEWLHSRLGWKTGGSPAEKALTYLLNSQAPGFFRALTIAVPA